MSLVCCLFAGCSNEKKTPDNPATPSTAASRSNTKVSTTMGLEKDLCAKCGCCAGCEECCKGEKCEECGMQKGSELCCTGVATKAEGTYCKECGYLKGTDKCCADGNVKCEKCGLAAGSDLCCKVNPEDDNKGHEHAEGDHDDDQNKG
jgi:hypothetical protein